MATERDTLVVNKSGSTINVATPNDARQSKGLTAEEFEKYKARYVEILDRGFVNDRMAVMLPEDTHGEWVSNDDATITRYRSLGFQVDTVYASNAAMHSDGTKGPSVIGDVIFMTIPKDYKHMFDQVQLDRYKRVYENADRERRELDSNINSIGVLQSSSKTSVDQIGIQDIEAALKPK